MPDREMIIKLARLANNNPNEHEANAAARRVAKMIAEDNFAILVQHAPAGTFRSVSNPSRPRPTTWNDIHRSQEPFWRPPRWDDFYGDWASSPGAAKKAYEAQEAERERQRRKEAEEKQAAEDYVRYGGKYWSDEYQKVYEDLGGDAWYNPTTGNRETKAKDVKRTLKCKICSKTEATSYMGPESNFRCNSCRFESFRSL